jgi:hypothetical protein
MQTVCVLFFAGGKLKIGLSRRGTQKGGAGKRLL